VLIWQLSRYVLQSWHSGDVAPTLLATPLWIPQSLMPIGAVVVTISLLRSAALNFQRCRR
jgi:TRAP-type mannitol/chloroaromatic compound transport system permease small subunit